MLSKNFKLLHVLWVIGFGVTAVSCAPVVPRPSTVPRESQPQQPEIAVKAPEQPGSRAMAALQLTEQGRMFLEKDNPDHAIRLLERAINLDPKNGQNYYFLSKAWLMKGDIAQAAEFNRLAEIYLGVDDKWRDKVLWQKKRISEYYK